MAMACDGSARSEPGCLMGNLSEASDKVAKDSRLIRIRLSLRMRAIFDLKDNFIVLRGSFSRA
jgi:hypothetical protein